MANKQLQLVANWEKDKEDKYARDFQLAQQAVQQNQQKLAGLEQYRLDYLRQLNQKASQGLGSQHYHQHHAFIGKLDKACQQQTQVLSNARLVADQRKVQWLAQQRKRKAVEHLLEQQARQQQQRSDRHEQQLLDEFALQRFLRKA